MIHSRIREIRKAKGLTLQEVAERAGTTAQTIGRLETGMRTLSIKWVNRIAQALDTDSSALLALPEGGDIAISGAIKSTGEIIERSSGTVALRLTASDPVAIRVNANVGEFQPGDILIFDRNLSAMDDDQIGKDCLAICKDGTQFFGKIVRSDNQLVTLLIEAKGSHSQLISDISLESAAPLVTMIRDYG